MSFPHLRSKSRDWIWNLTNVNCKGANADVSLTLILEHVAMSKGELRVQLFSTCKDSCYIYYMYWPDNMAHKIFFFFTLIYNVICIVYGRIMSQVNSQFVSVQKDIRNCGKWRWRRQGGWRRWDWGGRGSKRLNLVCNEFDHLTCKT